MFQGHNTFPFGVGVAMFDQSGKLKWKKANHAHHWFDIDDDGLIYVPTQRLLDSPIELGTDRPTADLRGQEGLRRSGIAVLDRDGKVVDEFSLFDTYIDFGYEGLLERTRSKCDPLHLNDVRVLKAD